MIKPAPLLAELGVDSTTITPDEVTALLGVAPTTVSWAGERRRPGAPLRQFHSWSLTLGTTEISSSIDEILVQRLSELGEPVAARLAQLCLRGADVVLTLLQHLDPERSETHGIALPTPVVAWLARAGACISIDQ